MVITTTVQWKSHIFTYFWQNFRWKRFRSLL